MVAYRIVVLAALAASMAACTQAVLPKPDYVSVKPPAPYRTAPDGLRVDNEDYAMDAQGYRLGKNGERIGEVDIDAKTGTEASSAMAGMYVSSTGTYAPGKVMTPSEGAAAGAGYGPGSAGIEPVAMPATTPTPNAAPAAAPAATGAPVPLAPAQK